MPESGALRRAFLHYAASPSAHPVTNLGKSRKACQRSSPQHGARRRSLTQEAAVEHGADYLIDVAVAAVAQGDGKLGRAARAAHVREVMRANGATGRRGRPMKGDTPRDARLVCYVERRVRDLIAEARGQGESYADVITRWAEQHGGPA